MFISVHELAGLGGRWLANSPDLCWSTGFALIPPKDALSISVWPQRYSATEMVKHTKWLVNIVDRLPRGVEPIIAQNGWDDCRIQACLSRLGCHKLLDIYITASVTVHFGDIVCLFFRMQRRNSGKTRLRDKSVFDHSCTAVQFLRITVWGFRLYFILFFSVFLSNPAGDGNSF